MKTTIVRNWRVSAAAAATFALLAAGVGGAWGAAPATDAPASPPPGGMGMHHGPRGPGGGPGDGMFGGGPRMLEHLATELGLTDAQRQQIRGVFESAKPEMQQVQEQMRSNFEKLEATKPDDPNYAAVVSEVSKNAADLASRRVTDGAQLRSQIWAVLTPDQRTKLAALQQQRKADMKARMQKFRDRRPGGPTPPPPPGV
jgi:Spy/CpxP family protein refolding chaperone